MTDTTVKLFTSTMSGAPSLSGEAGTLVGVLDACLQDGFGSIELNSLVVNSNVATGTVNSGHNFAMMGVVGPVIRINGATPSGLNGDWRIASVPGSTTFTFATAGIADQTATGTITAKRAPAGWTKAYSGTNKAAYQANSLASTRLYLRVDDTPAQYPKLIMYESMSDVDTGTKPGPTSGNFYFSKSNLSSTATRPWTLYADHKSFYLFSCPDNTNWSGALFFGDIISALSTDAFHCALIAHETAINTSYFPLIGYSNGSVIARALNQLGGAIAVSRTSAYGGSYLGSLGYPYPNTDNSFFCCDITIWVSSYLRGALPGILNSFHAASNFTQGQEIILNSGTPVAIQKLYYNSVTYCCAFNKLGPWRTT